MNEHTCLELVCGQYDGLTPDGRQQRSDFKFFNQVMEQFSSMNFTDKKDKGHTLDNMVVECVYAGGKSHTDFKYFSNNYHGNCYTFNSATSWNENSSMRMSRKAGPRYGLSILFNVEQKEYVGQMSQSAGLRVVVHDPARMPFPEDEGILVAPNALTHIAVTMVNNFLLLIKTQKINGLYGNCRSTDQTDKNLTMYQKLYNVSYCEKGCLYTCLNDQIIQNCDCVDIKFPKPPTDKNSRTDLRPCSADNSTITACVDKIWRDYENENLPCSSDCTVPCSETLYKPVISREIWPSKNYLAQMAQTPNYLTLFNELNKSDSQDYGQFVVFLQDFSYTSIDESPAYEIMQFSSDIGGILGLYVGFSILTIVEFFELAADILGLICFHIYSSSKTSVKNWRREKKIRNCNRVLPFKKSQISLNEIYVSGEDDEDEEEMDPRGKPRTGSRASVLNRRDMTSVHI
ncbi:hypothetical protein HELRODRAFT_168363 [Helobdella robusta]|uniref:Uncharacterized protein n=1 Tax=Helobdella robusta TaxID=6412 RepID=T1F0H2_HELRO|nr:hypothetical protein HELRODRAFT_168363 [Helobdella robusta]ESO09382.1 hypothetical protein HELRODRAFT_168363 [Helobdella robusta]